MIGIVFKGRFESENLQDFIDKLQTICIDTKTIFNGQIMYYDVPKYVEYEEVEINSNENKENLCQNQDDVSTQTEVVLTEVKEEVTV